MKFVCRLSAVCLFLLTVQVIEGCSGGGSSTPMTEHDRRMEWFREARFGLFIHWGLYAIPAGHWGDRTNHAEWIMTTAQIPVERYEQFVDEFNPVKFDADAWVRTAKRAGMKYIVITSKHHDGFCLFDSDYTDYDVMSTPFKRDIMKELSDACRRHGLKMCWYHSIMDWHHPDYLPRRGWETRSSEGADFDHYVEHLHHQVTELLTNYGPIGIMWFDGEWEATWNHDYGQPLYDLCLELQPDVIVNNRVDKGRGGMAGITADSMYAGDYGTPEQEIPPTGIPGVDWETCMTMNDHWGYNKSDFNYKSSEDLIRKLVDIASKGGNFLLNVGPTAEGEFPQQSIERLRDMGEWMDVNGEAIYGTTASPFSGITWGRCTVKERGGRTRLYLHVFDWPEEGSLVLKGIGNDFYRAYLLADRGTRIRVSRQESDLHLSLPSEAPDDICSVVVLEIKGSPVVYGAPAIEAVSRILVRPIEIELKTGSQELTLHYTLDGTDPGADSPLYEGPITITSTTVVKARTFHNGRAVSGISEAAFTKVIPKPAERVRGLTEGVKVETFHGDWDLLPDFDRLGAVSGRNIGNFRIPPGEKIEYVGHRFISYVEIPADDVYIFSLTSDDGARLFVGGELVVDNDGLHGTLEKRGNIALAEGYHKVVVEWFNKTGGAELAVMFAPVGGGFRTFSPSSLRCLP